MTPYGHSRGVKIVGHSSVKIGKLNMIKHLPIFYIDNLPKKKRTKGSSRLDDFNWTLTQNVFDNPHHQFPLTFSQFRNLLDRIPGNSKDVLPIVSEFSQDFPAIATMPQDDALYLSLPHRGIKNKCTRLSRKLLEITQSPPPDVPTPPPQQPMEVPIPLNSTLIEWR